MVTKTIPSKPKASKMEAELSAEEDSLTPLNKKLKLEKKQNHWLRNLLTIKENLQPI